MSQVLEQKEHRLCCPVDVSTAMAPAISTDFGQFIWPCWASRAFICKLVSRFVVLIVGPVQIKILAEYLTEI